MIKIKRHLIPALISGFLMPVIGLTVAACSHQPEMPTKPLPAYSFDIMFPKDEEDIGTLTLKAGEATILPVAVTSNSEVPISIRLVQDKGSALPKSITFKAERDYVTLQQGEFAILHVIFTVAESAAPGKYSTGIHGELKEPVRDRALLTQRIHLNIIR